MCIQNPLQQYILEITNGGKDIADFFYATMHGQNPYANFHHQMEAAKQLRILGIDATPSPSTGECGDGGENPVRPEPIEPLDDSTENCELKTENRPVTDLDIINYEVARLIRAETNDGYTIADFLARVMRGTNARLLGYLDNKEVISEADRMAAAKELMNRGLGKFGDSRSHRLSSSQDDRELIRSGLARYIRERTDYGTEAARFMVDVASGQDEKFSMHQRVVATRELMRRGWDTNFDAITPEDIAANHERQDTLEPTEYDIALREWREAPQPVGAAGRSPEDEPQLESGLFAHLTEAEIARYEAMSAKEQAEFVEQQRKRRARRNSHDSDNATQPDFVPVIPAEAGIHAPNTPDDFNAAETGIEPDENLEIIDWNAMLQDVSVPIRTPHPTHPVRSQTRIRSP